MDAEFKATAPQVTCWTSALRAVLWKEWRQQWLPFVLLAGLAPLIMLVGAHWSPFVAAGSATLVVWVGIPLILGANAFAGEHDQGTDAFLHALPASAGWFFRAKFLAVGALSLVGFLPVLLLSPMLPYCPDKLWLEEPVFWLGLGALTAIYVISTVAAVASFRGRVLATLLVSMILAVVGAAWLRLCAAFLTCFSWRYGALCPMVLFGPGLALAGANWLSSRPKETLATSVVRGVGAAIGYAVLVAGPAVISYLYVLFAITPDTYLQDPPAGWCRTTWISQVAPGAARHHSVALQCEHTGYDYGSLFEYDASSTRVAFLDTESGKWLWFDRYHRSHTDWWRNDPWSPDGSKCLVAKSKPWIWPLGMLNPGAPFDIDPERRLDTETAWVFRADKGTSSQLPGLLPEGWFDNDWVYSCRDLEPGQSWTGLPFYNVSTGERSVCRSSDPPLAGPLMRADVGVFGIRLAMSVPGVEGGRTRAVVQRYHPKMGEAEETVLSHSWEQPCLLDLSANGRWLLVGELRDCQRGLDCPRAYFVRPDRGIVRDLAPPPGLVPIRSPVFVPGAERAVVLLADGVAVYDLDTDQWRPFRLPAFAVSDPARDNPASGWIKCSPDGRHAVLRIYNSEAPSTLRGTSTVIDLDSGRHWPVETDRWRSERDVQWLSDKALLIQCNDGLWIVNRDGTRVRRLLPRQPEGAP